jgi:hypothetical protein
MIERRLLVGTGAALLVAAAIAGADVLLSGPSFRSIKPPWGRK